MATWNIDNAHSIASFSVKHMMVTNVRGTFSGVNGTLEYDLNNPANATVNVTIDTNTVNTGSTDRDNHLRSADFFNVENHPHMVFKSTRVEVKNERLGVLHGDLTIAGVTRPMAIEVEMEGHIERSLFGDERIAFTGETKINREDFGLTWNQALETGGWLVGKDIKIMLEVQAVKVTEAAPAGV
jgi:polyisoprenoid-binding protein YceI